MMKETKYQVVNCICAWYDLLGFGKPLMESNWNLNDINCAKQLDRINSLDLNNVNKYSYIYGTTSFSLNDGIILNFDIATNVLLSKKYLVNVLDDLILEFESLNYRDVNAGHPGVRGVLTFGHRFNYTDAESTILVANNRTIAYHPKDFQMNTAFSKAYIIESSGKEMGIEGSYLYIDKLLFDFVEQTLTENNEQNNFKIEKNLSEEDENKYFSIFQGDNLLLKVQLDNVSIDYNLKGIDTKLYRHIKRESRQDELAREAAYREGQRYLQAESEE